ncbi:MAG: FmdB family zinc ribbon protein [Sphingomonadaceae bacterium]
MPVYVYECEDCGALIEKRQSFSDAPLTECESCHGRLHKVLQPTAIVFKGSGFYCTDNRSSSGGSNGRNGSGHKEESKPSSEASKESTTTTTASADKSGS